MDAKLKADWIKALRSGEYRQADGLLRDASEHVSSYCCLGVLCEVMGACWVSSGPQLNGVILQAADEEFLSEETLQSIGLPASEQTKLASMNDDGMPFPKIADYIETSNL